MKQSPQAVFVSLTRNLKRIARRGDLIELRGYIAKPEFRGAPQVLSEERLDTVLALYTKARVACEARTPLYQPWAKRANWRDPAMVAKFRRAWAKTGSDEATARLCGITKGAARLARKQFIDASATIHMAQAA